MHGGAHGNWVSRTSKLQEDLALILKKKSQLHRALCIECTRALTLGNVSQGKHCLHSTTLYYTVPLFTAQ
jgi:hypothetical protein